MNKSVLCKNAPISMMALPIESAYCYAIGLCARPVYTFRMQISSDTSCVVGVGIFAIPARFHLHRYTYPELRNGISIKKKKTNKNRLAHHLPSGNTCLNFKNDVVNRMMDALSNCCVITAGNGNNFPSSVNSVFSFSRLVRAAFLLFSFMACNKAGSVEKNKKKQNG